MEYGIPHTVNTYYDLSLPEESETDLPLIIATHGYSGAKKSMMRLAKKVDRHRRFAIASLQGLHQQIELGQSTGPGSGPLGAGSSILHCRY